MQTNKHIAASNQKYNYGSKRKKKLFSFFLTFLLVFVSVLFFFHFSLLRARCAHLEKNRLNCMAYFWYSIVYWRAVDKYIFNGTHDITMLVLHEPNYNGYVIQYIDLNRIVFNRFSQIFRFFFYYFFLFMPQSEKHRKTCETGDLLPKSFISHNQYQFLFD